MSPTWLRETFDGFRQCAASLRKNLDASCFTDEFMAYSQHGIGHVTRVMFWSFLLSRWCKLSENTQRNAVLSAFLHDLARENQRIDTEHGSIAANSALATEVFDILNLPKDDQDIIREAVRQHCIEPSDMRDMNSRVSEVLRNADAIERGRFGKPWSHSGCDPRRLTLLVFQEYPGSDVAIGSIAHRIALFTRYENWSGRTYNQLVNRIASALEACVYHDLLTGTAKEAALAILNLTKKESESAQCVEIHLSGCMIPHYFYTEHKLPQESAAWKQHGSLFKNFTLNISVSCEWEESPVACVLENIITRGTPCLASRFVTNTAISLFSAHHNQQMDLEFTSTIHQIQRTLTHLMAGQALSVDAPKWRIAISGITSLTAFVAIVDFYHLLRSIQSLQKNIATIPSIDLLLITRLDNINIEYEENVQIHTSPTGLYDAHIDIHNDKLEQVKTWKNNLKYIHHATVISNQSKNEILNSPVRCSEPIEYVVDLDNESHIDALNYVLRNIFWKDEFRSGQLEVIARGLRRQDVIALLPTGVGKSLTYQLTALLQPGLTIVIDPLKSLMRDQDKSLKAYGIDRTIFINSSLNANQIDEAMKQVAKGLHQFIFVSPERLQIKKF